MSVTTSPYSAIYAFGDSLSDAGDAYLLTTSAYATALGVSPEPVSPPYYRETYGGSLSADVFSNGPVWVQDLAVSLGLGTLAPGPVGVGAETLLSLLEGNGISASYASSLISLLETAQHVSGADPWLQLVAGATGGTDFAIGGSVTGPTGFNSGATASLTDLAAQFANFQAAVPTPSPDALYTVWSGSNDLLNLLESASFASLSASGALASDITASVENEVTMVEDLAAIGAKTILVVNVPNLGLTPEITANEPGEVGAASSIAAEFDQLLATDLGAALVGNPGGAATIVLENAYQLIDQAAATPSAYGLTNVTSPVYSGGFGADNGSLVSTLAAIQNQYLFFDHLHPTETAQQAVAREAEIALGLIACFAAGTRILTPRGEIPVERLALGEHVITRAGTDAPILWIGRRGIDLRRHPRPQAAQPIRIAAGALGEGLPSRDLILSPDHALYLDGCLIPAKALINGENVVQLERERVTYFHLELAEHDVIFAEGTAVETYLDTGNRGAFENAGVVTTLHPDLGQTLRERQSCAPFTETGEAVDTARARLRARQYAVAA